MVMLVVLTTVAITPHCEPTTRIEPILAETKLVPTPVTTVPPATIEIVPAPDVVPSAKLIVSPEHK
jgi:hypothetical protein